MPAASTRATHPHQTGWAHLCECHPRPVSRAPFPLQNPQSKLCTDVLRPGATSFSVGGCHGLSLYVVENKSPCMTCTNGASLTILFRDEIQNSHRRPTSAIVCVFRFLTPSVFCLSGAMESDNTPNLGFDKHNLMVLVSAKTPTGVWKAETSRLRRCAWVTRNCKPRAR